METAGGYTRHTVHQSQLVTGLIAETICRPKQFMRIGPDSTEIGVECGWVLGATAFQLWTMKGVD